MNPGSELHNPSSDDEEFSNLADNFLQEKPTQNTQNQENPTQCSFFNLSLDELKLELMNLENYVLNLSNTCLKPQSIFISNLYALTEGTSFQNKIFYLLFGAGVPMSWVLDMEPDNLHRSDKIEIIFISHDCRTAAAKRIAQYADKFLSQTDLKIE